MVELHIREGQRLSVEEHASLLESLPQVACPLTHEFAPGIYMRTIFMPASRQGEGTAMVVVGTEHKTEHWNIIHTGRALVSMDGVLHTIEAPCMFVSKPGVRKVLWIQEDMLWTTCHPNPDDERDIETLVRRLVSDPENHFAYQRECERLRALAKTSKSIEQL